MLRCAHIKILQMIRWSRSWITDRWPRLDSGLRLINLKDSLTANLNISWKYYCWNIQEDGRGIFATSKKMTEFIVILICKVYPCGIQKELAVLEFFIKRYATQRRATTLWRVNLRLGDKLNMRELSTLISVVLTGGSWNENYLPRQLSWFERPTYNRVIVGSNPTRGTNSIWFRSIVG